eukprot:365142-Chlamydomonas_euryale.AAC.11
MAYQGPRPAGQQMSQRTGWESRAAQPRAEANWKCRSVGGASAGLGGPGGRNLTRIRSGNGLQSALGCQHVQYCHKV